MSTFKKLFFITLVTVCSVTAQTLTITPSYKITLSFKNGDETYYHSFGVNTGNSHGGDTASTLGIFKEDQLPPAPPAPFEWWSKFFTLASRSSQTTWPSGIPGTGMTNDYHGYTSSTQVDSFRIELSGDSVRLSTTIKWPKQVALYADSMKLYRGDLNSDFLPTSAPSINMFTNDSAVIPAKSGSGSLTRRFYVLVYGCKSGVSVTELITPKYVAGRTDATVHQARMPFITSHRISGLIPNQSYDLMAGVAEQSENGSEYGGGSVWDGSAFGTHERDSAFTTNDTGTVIFFMTLRPEDDGARFEAGQQHSVRFGIVPSGGTLPADPQFIGGKLMTALDIASTARTAGISTDDGAFIHSVGTAASYGKYVLLFDNTSGTGDPIYATQIRNASATNSTQSELPVVIDDIFRQSGTSSVGSLAAVIPTSDVNTLGVRRVETRDSANTLLIFHTSADGVWGAVPTANASRREVKNISGNTPLPVELSAFSAAVFGNGIFLRWKTNSETDNHGFAVERKLEKQSEWIQTGFIQGQGTTNTATEYSFVDRPAVNVRLVYRLKQIDRNGAFTYSQEVSVMAGTVPNVFTLSNNYPNPFNPSTSFTFSVPDSRNVTIEVFNAIGQRVAVLFDSVADAGTVHSVTFTPNAISTGLYFVKAKYEGITLTKKIMLLK